MLLVSSCSCLCPIHWSQVLSWQWRCSWSSADRRCSNYIWVINNFSAYKGASYIRDFTVFVYQACPPCSIMKDPGVSAECYLIMLETAGISHQPSATAVLTWLELRLVLEWYLFEKYNIQHIWWGKLRADRRFALSQWETSLQSNAVSHRLGANLESTLNTWLKRLYNIRVKSHACDSVSIHWLHIQQLVHSNNKGNTKALYHWPFLGGIHRSLADSPQEGQ